MLRRTIELGIDHIDTSQNYAPDVVNDLIPEALHPHPANLVWLDFLRAEPSITRIG
jgi:aryl-alcohol dehydrogenase-like predicted oxidoreductase